MARRLLEKALTRQSLIPLLKRHVQRWRTRILAKNGAIVVERPKEHVRVTDERFEVLEGDSVMLDDPLPPECAKALLDRVNTDRLDFFVLPDTPDDLFIKNLRLLLNVRTASTAFASDVATLQDFAAALRLRADFPVRNIIIGCHATHNADLLIPFKQGSERGTRFEDLVKATQPGTAGNSAGNPDFEKLLLDDEVLQPRPVDTSGNPLPVTLYIFGCYMGRFPRYLEELKKAFGPQVTRVWASKYLIAAEPTPEPEGLMEFLLYEYMVTRPTAVRSRSELLKAFQAGGFTRYDGRTAVTNAEWESWLPKDITKDGTGARLRMARPDPLPPANMRAKFLHETLSIPETTVAEGVTRPASEKELQDEGRRLIKIKLGGVERFKDTHPFPMATRLGYSNLDKLIEGFSWVSQFVPDEVGNKGKIRVKGTRHEYMLRVPVVSGKNLLFNWYPVGTRHKSITLLAEHDTNFFTTV